LNFSLCKRSFLQLQGDSLSDYRTTVLKTNEDTSEGVPLTHMLDVLNHDVTNLDGVMDVKMAVYHLAGQITVSNLDSAGFFFFSFLFSFFSFSSSSYYYYYCSWLGK